jgi:1-deoxy-D-xylulose-5-phosphate synthase
MTVASPMNEEELRNLMYSAQLEENAGPISIRYPRGEGVMTNWKTPFKAIKMGTGRKVKNGKDVAVLSIGPLGNTALSAAQKLEKEGISLAVYDMRFVKPLDEILLHEVFTKFKNVITVEDGCLQGGMGSAILEFMGDHGYSAKVVRLGIPDKFVDHGTQKELYAECFYDENAIIETARKLSDSVRSISAAV